MSKDNNERTKLRWIALVQGYFEDGHLYSKSLLLTELFCCSDRRVVLIYASFVTDCRRGESTNGGLVFNSANVSVISHIRSGFR